MKKNTIIVMAAAFAASLALTGCAGLPMEQSSPMATLDGSRADGTVTVGYYVTGYYIAMHQPNFTGAQERAAKSCKVWGYTGAQAFDDEGYKNACATMHGGTCTRLVFSKEFQCTGNEPGAVNK
ncbi:hypothetical protein DOC35_19505 [Salmonella enterica subsp. enterica]|nr:hypothetical protein [Salmonella enterica subsp. enterica]